MDAFVFVTAGVIAVLASALVVTRRNPVYSAIYLVLFFTMISLQFLALRAPFLAVIQVLVYAGAIMVLFLFVLMLLNLTGEELAETVSRSRKIQAAVGSAALFALLAATISSSPTVRNAPPLDGEVTAPLLASAGETKEIARSLFSIHMLPFELTSFLIMVAIIGAIYLTKRRQQSAGPDSAGGAEAREEPARGGPVLSAESTPGEGEKS